MAKVFPLSLASSPPRAHPTQIAAVLFDWAGTIMDFGCMAPVRAFAQAFAAFDIPLTDAQLRAPMGKPAWRSRYSAGH